MADNKWANTFFRVYLAASHCLERGKETRLENFMEWVGDVELLKGSRAPDINAGLGSDLAAPPTSVLQKKQIVTGLGEKVQSMQIIVWPALRSYIASGKEVVEGLRTLKIVKNLAQSYNLQLPITSMLYSIVYEGYDLRKAINLLMKYPIKKDVVFIW